MIKPSSLTSGPVLKRMRSMVVFPTLTGAPIPKACTAGGWVEWSGGAPAAAQTTPGAPLGHPGHPQDAQEASQGSPGVILGVPGPLARLHFGVHFEVISVSFVVRFLKFF